MYVAVKGGERAIANAHRWLAGRAARRSGRAGADAGADPRAARPLAVDRVMNEGSCYDRDLAALAIKQAAGDLVEAAFLLRAYRTTLPRFGASEPIDTAADAGAAAHLRDLQGPARRPGAGADLRLHPSPARFRAPGGRRAAGAAPRPRRPPSRCRRHWTSLDREGLIQAERDDAPEADVPDLTREPLLFPAERALRLQNLARGDEGFLLALGYSTQRGFGGTHPFVGELRMGEVAVELVPEELGFAIEIGSDHAHRVPDGQPVRGLARRAAAVHPRLRPGLRPCRAPGDEHGPGRPGLARRRSRDGTRRHRRRTRSSCSTIRTMCRRRASSST